MFNTGIFGAKGGSGVSSWNDLTDKPTLAEKYGSIPTATKDILLDNDNWAQYSNDCTYDFTGLGITPESLGLYPGLKIMNISGKYYYECTNDNIFRCIKSQPTTVENIAIEGTDTANDTLDYNSNTESNKLIISTLLKGSFANYYATVNIKLIEASLLNFRPLKVMFSEDNSAGATTVNILKNDNTLLTTIAVGEVIEIETDGINYYFKKW